VGYLGSGSGSNTTVQSNPDSGGIELLEFCELDNCSHSLCWIEHWSCSEGSGQPIRKVELEKGCHLEMRACSWNY